MCYLASLGPKAVVASEHKCLHTSPSERAMATHVPPKLTIGTKKAFRNNYAFPYELHQIGSERIYVCNKGSEWARPAEFLILRYYHGTWIAYDGSRSANGSSFHCRQAVFRCHEDITLPVWHEWQTNYAADASDSTGIPPDWQGALWAETRLQ